ncbi:ribose-phosphate pyrophosphokinase [Ostreibacterium oceani]|uniref:Ribose-phosphate pyrophosphokinase n=1 Tax=Ostreibacterium oceani TaxID=2654998 RepID=A0A6N7EWP7_9GAMM|nr:ribose-phosphate pyrophosphokinase [Ostreibacterium oceani]MPV85547.1 ribose-phosphate diphosphokinase [Ostreibacterium oceani]
MTIFSGNANPQLARLISQHLGLPLGQAMVDRFSDGEINIELKENVRGKDVFIIQPTCSPTNDNLMELMVMTDALRRSSAQRITAVMPYFGYSRQDRRPRSSRVAISAKVVANMLTGAGVDRVLTIDLHADQIQGFFDIPVDNIYATPILLNDILSLQLDNPMVVSPDIGGVLRARATAKRVPDAALAIIDKRRPKANESEVMNIIGENIEGKNCLLIDDMVDTAGTLAKAANALKDKGAKSVRAYCTHPVLSGNALKNIENSALDELVVTDTIPLPKNMQASKHIRVVSVSGLVAESIRRIHVAESISSLFVD